MDDRGQEHRQRYGEPYQRPFEHTLILDPGSGIVNS